MDDSDTPLSGALADVRRAWRLVYAYQRRVNDMLALIDTALGAKKFAFVNWKPTDFSAPARSGTPFFRAGTWAWDMLPGYRLYTEWSRWSGKVGVTHRVTINVSADSGFKKSGGEPDPSDFTPACDAESVVWLGCWTATTQTPDWSAAWAAFSSQGLPKGTTGTTSVGDVAYTFRSEAVYIDDLAEPGDVTAQIIDPILAWAAAESG